jgi:hypothetical protein
MNFSVVPHRSKFNLGCVAFLGSREHPGIVIVIILGVMEVLEALAFNHRRIQPHRNIIKSLNKIVSEFILF